MLEMGRAFRIALQAEAHMFKKWEAAHRELGPFVWSEDSIPEFRQSGGQGLSERCAKDAKRKTFNEYGVKTTSVMA
ncbi:hypothetical protein DW180_00715 [Collinsella sp. AM16-21]|nr:hypothetical protein DW180_00715 [Collinsella sp. AM16-21]